MPFLFVIVGLFITITMLSVAKGIIIPLAFAILMTFLLSPAVNAIVRIGLGRSFAAVLIVVLFFFFIGSVGWLVSVQITNFATDLPGYTDNLKKKIDQVRLVGSTGSIQKIQQAIDDVTNMIEQRIPKPKPKVPAESTGEPIEKQSVLFFMQSLLEPILTALMVMVLVIFLLIEHGALRDRIIAFRGYARLTLTTKALDEASRRISHYLIFQALVNGSFGAMFGLGLFAIGLPYALLWGILAAAMRFVPYVGTTIGAVLPILFSMAFFPGWTQPLIAASWFLVLELTTFSLVEPLLYGWSTGISKVALLVSIMFWTWLWGPVGLLLSTPLTVCLSVLGKNIPQLGFLDMLLSDQPVKGMNTCYQRLVARNQDDASKIVEENLKTMSLVEMFDAVLVPVLTYVKQDRERDILTAVEETNIVNSVSEIVEDLETHRPVSTPTVDPTEDPSVETIARITVVACPARDEKDLLALQMFKQVCDPKRFDFKLLPVSVPLADLFARVTEDPSRILLIAAVSPGGFARTRYLCKRLRQQLPELEILVGRWGETTDSVAENMSILRTEGIRYAGSSLRETLHQLLKAGESLSARIDAAPKTNP